MWQVYFPAAHRGSYGVVGVTDGNSPLEEDGFNSLLGMK